MKKIFSFLFSFLVLAGIVTAGIFDFLNPPEEELLANVSYTPTTDTICNEGVCTLTLYSGVRNAYEDNEWKRIENAKSLKGYYNKVYLKNDPNYEIEIEDFNYTCLKKLKLKSQISGNIPFKLNDISFISPYMEEGQEIELEDICMNEILGFNFTLGNSSTTIMLQDADSENLDDDDNYNAGSNIAVWAFDENYAGYKPSAFKFNISSIPAGQTINDASFWFFILGDAPNTFYCYEYSNHTWNEEDGISDTSSVGDQLDSFSIPNPADWRDCSVTSWVASDYSGGNPDVSIEVEAPSSGWDYIQIVSKEHSTTSQRPYLNITYSEVVSDTCTCTDAENWEINMTDYCIHSTACSPANVTFIDVGNFTCNAVLNATSVEGLSADQRGYVTSNCRGLFR